MRVRVIFGKEKKVKISTDELFDKSITEILSEKLGKTVSKKDIKSFDGTTAIVVDGEAHDVEIDENELIDSSIRELVRKKLKTRKSFDVKVVKK